MKMGRRVSVEPPLEPLQGQTDASLRLNRVSPHVPGEHLFQPVGANLLDNILRSEKSPQVLPERRHPSPGVFISRNEPTIAFLTVCTRHRSCWLIDVNVHRHLIEAWELSQTWMVGRYVLMPDHLHLCCSPLVEAVEIEGWVTFWKRQFRRLHQNAGQRFQTGCFHHRLRRQESYEERWDYVRENPVRAGLVKQPDEWTYSGVLNELRW